MMLAASLAGIGFGSAGVHIPHACAYPIAVAEARVHAAGLSRRPPVRAARLVGDRHRAGRVPLHVRGRPGEAPAAAELIAGEPSPTPDEDTLPEVLTDLMRDVGAPSGVRELGYDEDDISALVEGAMKQQRLLVVSPREPSAEDVAAIIARLYGELAPAAASAGSPASER